MQCRFRQIRLILGYVLVFFLILFWTAPIIFISGLTKLESAGLRSELGFLDKRKLKVASFQEIDICFKVAKKVKGRAGRRAGGVR